MNPLDAARAVLPAWLPLVSLLALPFAFGAAWLLARLLTPLAFRRALAAKDAHWTERARLVWPARKWSAFAVAAVPAVVGAAVASLGGPLALLGPGTAGLLGGAAALAGWALGTWPTARRLRGPGTETLGRFLAGAVALLLVRAPHLVVAVAVAAFMPPRLAGHGAEAAALLVLGTILVFAAAFGGGVAVGRLFALFRTPDERLRGAVSAAAAHAGVAPPMAAVMTSPLPLAFAIPLRRILVVSDSALALLEDGELAAVVAHETGHLTESRSVTLQRVAGLLVFTLLMAAPSLAGEGGRTAFLAVLLTLLALVALGAFSRRTALEMEVRADAHAASHAEGAVYARALERMHEGGLVPAVLSRRFATHPDLWDRMAAAGGAPPWPKPAPPACGAPARFALALACAAAFVALEVWRPRALASLSRRSPLAAVALSGGAPWPLSELARERDRAGRSDESVALYRAAFALDGRPGHLANGAFAASRGGRCDVAKALAEEAGVAASRAGTAAWDRHLAERAARVAERCGPSGARIVHDD